MKQSKVFIPTLREMPSDAQVISHALLVRAGYIRQVSAGIYTYLPLANRVLEKIKSIMREEFAEIGATEFLAPALLNAELWQESGRYETYGSDLYKLKNRDGSAFILGPTHEETVTLLVRNELTSYKQLPMSMYQIQTKYRDEKRPRYGLLRGREFIMKDGYSFHANEESLAESYNDFRKAYEKIFTRVGLDFKGIIGDGGAMGGQDSQEFMAITADRKKLENWLVLDESVPSISDIPTGVLEDIQAELSRWLVAGEDVVAFSEKGAYAANLEMASSILHEEEKEEFLELKKVETPGRKTIQQVVEFLDVPIERTIKTLFYQVDEELIAILLRGEDELNEVKLAKLFDGVQAIPANEEAVKEAVGAGFGSLGPVNLDGIKIIADYLVEKMSNVVVGANEESRHYLNANLGRDYVVNEFVDLRVVKEGELAPDGKGQLRFARGIEIGHIFKLGDRYTRAMNANILDENGKAKPMIMGSYGIGVSRLLSAILEQNAKLFVERLPKGDYKYNWIINFPKEVSPYDIHLLPLNTKDEATRNFCEKLEKKLEAKGYSVLVDDRNERAGVKFADSDLIGLPYRVTIGKHASEGIVELKIRNTGNVLSVTQEELLAQITQ